MAAIMEAAGTQSNSTNRADGAAVPVTIVTGFLGSGKTTLLNHILTAQHGRRIAVIENEFGDEVGIEKLIARDGRDGAAVPLDDLFVELSNGCVCCAVRDDLVTTLEALLERRSRHPFEQIIIETSGLADPGPLASIFWLDEELESRIFLDAIVTVVDLVHLERHLDDARKSPAEGVVNEALSQLAYADCVLMNKCDLVTECERERIAQRVRDINGLARQLPTEYSRVELSDILDVRAFDATLARGTYDRLLKASATAATAATADCAACVEEQCNGVHTHAAVSSNVNQHRFHAHDDSVRSVVVYETRPIDLGRLRYWLGELLWEGGGGEGSQIFRSKGVVNIIGSDCLHLLQAVHETFEVTPTKQRWDDEQGERLSRIVFIGRCLDLAALQTGLCNCCSEG